MDFLGQCVKESCGLLESSGGSGTTLTDNNKLLGVGDKQVGTTDATDLQFLTDNKIRAVLDSSGNFDVRDLRSSEIDLLPNQQFRVISGTATLSNFESTIQTTSLTDEFKTSRLFIPSDATVAAPHEVIIKVDSLSSSTFECGTIDSINNITLISGGAFALTAGDLITLTLIDLGGTERVNLKINDVLQGSEAVNDPSIEHNFYLKGVIGTLTITESKYNNVLQKGAINIADGNNYGLSIREETKDYLNIDTLNDAMTLSNVTDINTGSIIFNDNEIVIKKELVGSQESMVPNNTIVQQSNFSSLNGEILTIVSDETNITIPVMPSFTLGDKFELTLNIDKQTGTTGYYIGIGEYSVVPINYVNIPQSVYPTNVYYSTPTGFGGSFTPPGIWSVDPNFSAPNYNTVGLYEIKLVLEEGGEFNIYIDGTIKFSMTLVGSNTFECFIWTPTQGTAEFDTSYASMLSGDGGIVIDGYPVAQTFNQLLGGDPNTGVMTFKQVNTQGLIIGDEENIPDPTTDNSIRFGVGSSGIINAENLTLESEFKTSFVASGLSAEVVKIDHSNANLDLLGYHLQTDRIDIGSYTGPVDSIDDPLLWSASNNSNMILTTNTFNQQSTTQTAWGYTETFQPFGINTDINILFSTISAGSRHYVSIVSDEILNSISLSYQNSVTLQVSQFGVQKALVTRQAGVVTDNVPLGNGNYPSGTLVTFQIRDDIVKTLLNGVEIVSGVEFPITDNVYRISIKDTNTRSGDVVGTTNISVFSSDFTSKADNINIYSGTDIQFEGDMKFSRDISTGDDWFGFDVTNDEIDVFKDIQSTGDISCVTLTTDTSLFPSVDTAKMLAVVSPYTPQIVYNTEEGQGKFCYFNGTTWQVTAETYQAVNDTASTTLLQGQTVQVNQGGNDGGVIQILTNGANSFAGIICFDDVVAGARCTVAEHGTWNFLCDSGTYTNGEFLQTSSTGRSKQTAGISSQTYAIILETKTLASPGYILARLRIYPP